jgi:hypothetical protein
MVQTIAKFLTYTKKGAIWKHPFRVYRMKNKEGLFWATFTEKSILDLPEKDLEGRIALLFGSFEYNESWKGPYFKVKESHPLSDKFLLTCWQGELKENIYSKAEREAD